MTYAEEMIEKDCFNNSAWSYRFYLIKKIVESKDSPEEQRAILNK